MPVEIKWVNLIMLLNDGSLDQGGLVSTRMPAADYGLPASFSGIALMPGPATKKDPVTMPGVPGHFSDNRLCSGHGYFPVRTIRADLCNHLYGKPGRLSCLLYLLKQKHHEAPYFCDGFIDQLAYSC